MSHFQYNTKVEKGPPESVQYFFRYLLFQNLAVKNDEKDGPY